MKYLTPPFIGRRVHFLLLGGLVLLLSCQSDPIVFNPTGGYEYKTKSFPLNIETSETIQGEQHTGTSPRLYSGIISLTESLNDTTSVLIRLLPDIFDTTYQFCNADSIAKINIKLNSITTLAEEDTSLLIQRDALKIYLMPQGHISETWDEDIVLNHTDINTISNDLNEYTLIDDSLIYIINNSIEIQLHGPHHNIIELWCANQENLPIGIIVSYIPNIDELDVGDPEYLEFISTDYSSGTSGLRLDLTYYMLGNSTFTENRYSINTVFSDLSSLLQPYYINADSTSLWGMVYAINLEDNIPPILEGTLQLNTIIVSEDLISSSQLNTEIPLLIIDVELNNEIIDSILAHGISFWIDNAAAFIYEIDPAEDNWNDTTGTENNNLLNWEDYNNNGQWDAGEGEEWFDYGKDNCPDSLETGVEGAACGSVISSYNPNGTENNGQLDWVDEDNDGLWTDGVDSGEAWMDVGIDGCTDVLETGDGECGSEGEENQALAGTDPNGDNFMDDPAGDDWDAETNPLGTEKNGIWNENEHFLDWGSDGLPESILGYSDATEDDGHYNIGEPFDDTGSDAIFSVDEDGYNAGTEGNKKFDGGGEFSDCGVDNCCNGEACDMIDDDYNIDPNEDNWNDYGTDGIQSLDVNKDGNYDDANDIAKDDDDTEDNGDWDEGEGLDQNMQFDVNIIDGDIEKYNDWGLDNISDEQEPFQQFTQPEVGDTLYNIDVSGSLGTQSFDKLESNSAEVSLWISDIVKTDVNSIQIKIMVYSKVVLKALSFQLSHEPFVWNDTLLQPKEQLIYSNTITGNKLFEDFTLLARADNPDSSVLRNSIQINYANDLAASIDFDGLNLFLNNGEYIYSPQSPQHANLVMYIDTDKSYIHNDGMWLFLGYTDVDSIYTFISSSADSIEFSIGEIMAGFQSGNLGSYRGFKLMTNTSLYNYSTLSILYNPDQPDKNPRLNIMYTQ